MGMYCDIAPAPHCSGDYCFILTMKPKASEKSKYTLVYLCSSVQPFTFAITDCVLFIRVIWINAAFEALCIEEILLFVTQTEVLLMSQLRYFPFYRTEHSVFILCTTFHIVNLFYTVTTSYLKNSLEENKFSLVLTGTCFELFTYVGLAFDDD